MLTTKICQILGFLFYQEFIFDHHYQRRGATRAGTWKPDFVVKIPKRFFIKVQDFFSDNLLNMKFFLSNSAENLKLLGALQWKILLE